MGLFKNHVSVSLCLNISFESFMSFFSLSSCSHILGGEISLMVDLFGAAVSISCTKGAVCCFCLFVVVFFLVFFFGCGF